LTRRRFLRALGAGAFLALANGCGLLGRTPKLTASRIPEARPLRAPKVWPLPGVPPVLPKGVWAFRSRPDLAPAAAEVTGGASGTAPGYVFLALKEGAGEHGPMILDDSGRLVWFEKYISARDFKVQRYRGRPVLTWWEGRVVFGHGVGEYVIFDDSYRKIARVRAGDGLRGDLHEFLITPEDTALLTAYAAVPADLSPAGGPEDGAAWDGIAQEIDLETGEVLFEWHSLEHVGVDESYVAPPEDPAYGHDYFHINSIDVDYDGNLLVSARNTWTVYKVDRKTGDIIWRLGGKNGDFEMGEGTRTAFQHDARRHEDGTLTVFDNGANLTGHDVSRAILLRLDEEEMGATLLGEYASPEGLLSTSQGDAQLLSDGNVFVGWGSQPYLSEFSGDGGLLLNASFPPECESYRAFRFPWSGHPTHAPAVAVERRSEDGVALYASWNGATEVAAWEVISGPRPSRMEPLGSVPRDGFETAMLAQSSHSYFAVRAKERSGGVLGTSAPVEL
jgi:outer membrane protein assembly factor BamB